MGPGNKSGLGHPQRRKESVWNYIALQVGIGETIPTCTQIPIQYSVIVGDFRRWGDRRGGPPVGYIPAPDTRGRRRSDASEGPARMHLRGPAPGAFTPPRRRRRRRAPHYRRLRETLAPPRPAPRLSDPAYQLRRIIDYERLR